MKKCCDLLCPDPTWIHQVHQISGQILCTPSTEYRRFMINGEKAEKNVERYYSKP